MTCWSKEELENMLFSVVDELELSYEVIEKHSALGTEPSVFVRMVLDQKDFEITCLKAGMKPVGDVDRCHELQQQLKEANARIEKYKAVVEDLSKADTYSNLYLLTSPPQNSVLYNLKQQAIDALNTEEDGR